MKTKILLSILFTTAVVANAASYNSGWSVFDSGLAQAQNASAKHTGVLGAWVSPFMPLTQAPQPAPLLTITLVGNQVRVSWPISATGFELEERAELNSGNWSTIVGPYQSDATEHFILAPVNQAGRFYRLRSL